MKPLKLTMQAFGSYAKETTISFENMDQNFFLIAGDTGAGKTTIFDAISYALYGEVASSVNKKSGVLLQSDYAPVDVEPFVELTFSEGQQSDLALYTVRRTPKRMVLMTRGEKKGLPREVSGTVSLIMPDGSEYPAKETNAKLEEIVGLTKDQFMQVAMIAQGEFMEMLRADSNSKKEIFRELFHTEHYREIIDELDRRQKAQQEQLSNIEVQCQTEAGRVQIPADYENMPILEKQKAELANGKFACWDEFLEGMGELCNYLKEKKGETEKTYQAAEAARDQARKQHNKAEELIKFYNQFDQANQDLETCREHEDEMKAKRILLPQISAAYELQTERKNLDSLSEECRRMQEEWKAQTEKLPELNQSVEVLSQKEADAKSTLDRERENFSKISEQVKRARGLFQQLSAAKEKSHKNDQTFMQKKAQLQELQDNMACLTSKEEKAQQTVDKLKKTEAKQIQLTNDQQRLAEIKREFEERSQERDNLIQQKKQKEDAATAYETSKNAYEQDNALYESMRQQFLDNQAGFLAKTLEEGKPCPVCGSSEHPHPCVSTEEYDVCSREELESKGEEVNRLRKKQEEAATQSKTANELFQAGCATYVQNMRTLLEHIGMDPSINVPYSEIESKVSDMETSLKQRESTLQQELQTLKKAQDFLTEVATKKGQLNKAIQKAEEERDDARAAWEQSQGEQKTLTAAQEFPSLAEAERILTEGKKAKEQAEKQHSAAQKAREEAAQSLQEAKTRIQKDEEELPSKQEQVERRRMQYEGHLQEKGLSDAEWRQIVTEHCSTESQKLQEELVEFDAKKAAAIEVRKNAEENIASRERPIMENILREKDETEKKFRELEKIRKDCDGFERMNCESYRTLSLCDIERKQVWSAFQKVERLYQLFAGKMTDNRMDLETFVQRCYLENILNAANQRFRIMSNGEFELRMTNPDMAGKGKNRGLDLMVYSTVTGKERDVSTISGGESFMAALSLALGMADQIQTNASGVHLDMMFIDEGFGSLDDFHRMEAIRVLKEMTDSSKMIGIISHVSELKQAIDVQLLVEKDENGSHAHWQTG